MRGKKNILFRVDGGNVYSIAMGHLYRCLRLAGILAKENVRCFFIMKNYPEGIALVEKTGFGVVTIGIDIPPEVEAEKAVSLAMKLDAIIFVDLRTTKKALIDLANERKVLTVVYEDVYDEITTPHSFNQSFTIGYGKRLLWRGGKKDTSTSGYELYRIGSLHQESRS